MTDIHSELQRTCATKKKDYLPDMTETLGSIKAHGLQTTIAQHFGHLYIDTKLASGSLEDGIN